MDIKIRTNRTCTPRTFFENMVLIIFGFLSCVAMINYIRTEELNIYVICLVAFYMTFGILLMVMGILNLAVSFVRRTILQIKDNEIFVYGRKGAPSRYPLNQVSGYYRMLSNNRMTLTLFLDKDGDNIRIDMDGAENSHELYNLFQQMGIKECTPPGTGVTDENRVFGRTEGGRI